MDQYQQHPDDDVRQAIVRLCDALCTWERSTGRESVLIIREEGFCIRAVSGKPDVPDDVPDEQLLSMVRATENCGTCEDIAQQSH
jgi:hypothetical protein